jgi:MATE family multidrug resistance protein
MIIAAIGYWLIGVPVSAYLGLRAGHGAVGLWWGLVVGLATVSATLLVRVAIRMRRDLARLAIDDVHATDTTIPATAEARSVVMS